MGATISDIQAVTRQDGVIKRIKSNDNVRDDHLVDGLTTARDGLDNPAPTLLDDEADADAVLLNRFALMSGLTTIHAVSAAEIVTVDASQVTPTAQLGFADDALVMVTDIQWDLTAGTTTFTLLG